MGKKKLTRFSVTCGGAESQVFKVRDNRDDISIVLANAETFTDAPFSGRKIIEQRYSIHGSPNSDHQINVIKQTVRLEGGDLIETILDSKGPKIDQLQPIFCRLCPTLDNDRYRYVAGPRDTIVSLGSYDPTKASFMFALFVTSLSGPTQVSSHSRYKQASHDFETYRLIVVYTEVPAPSHWRGQLIHAMTTVPRINKEQTAPKIVPFWEGGSPKEARAACLFFFGELHEIAFSFIPYDTTQGFLAALKKVGFGIWDKDDLRKKLRRAARG